MTSDEEIPQISLPPVDDFNGWADYYFHEWGVNVIPAPTIDKGKHEKDRVSSWIKTGWQDFQDMELTREKHEQFKFNGDYTSRKGLAVVAGKVWRGHHKGLWLTFLDCDNQMGIDVVLSAFGYESLQAMSKDFVVEQRREALDRAHIYFYSSVPMAQLTGLASKAGGKYGDAIKENKAPGIEIKSQHSGLAFATPSFHSNGTRYHIIEGGIPIPKRVLTEYELTERQDSIEKFIFDNYGFSYINNDGKIPMSEMLKPEFRIKQGNNRHNAVLRIGMHYLLLHKDRWQALEKTKQWNQLHCDPPLSEENYVDLPRTFEWSEKYVKWIREREAQDSKERKQTGKEKAINLATELVEEQDIIWFHDEYQTAYMRIKIANHYEIYRVFRKDRKLRLFLTKLYYDATGSTLKDDELNEVIRKLEANGIFSGNLRKIHLRKCWGIKGIDESTYQEHFDRDICFYDMCSPNWTCLMIDGNNESWELLPFHPENVTFFRYQQLPQAIPNRDYPKDIYDQWLDLMHINNENDRILFKVWFVAAFIPEQPHPLLIPHGPPGGAKSTFCKQLQIAIDPYAGEPLILPTEKKELAQQAHHRSLLIYDNVEYDIPKWLSDLLCQLITSANVSKRQLYTDDTDFAYVLGASALLQTAQAEQGHELFMSLFMPVIQTITGGHSSMARMHGAAPTSDSTMEAMSESQVQEIRQGRMGLIGNNILGSPATLPAGGLAVNIVAGAITFAIAAFVISWKQRSYLVAGLLAASGIILIILPLANLNFVIPGPIIGVIVGLMILGLGVAKAIRTATAVTVTST